ncbi:MAG: hypothetical protein AAF065_11870 [Verrucomicrobiota bacterium]
MKINTTQITIDGREVTLTFDKFALARFGCHRGTFAGLFDDGQRYYILLLLAWCALPDATRQQFAEPVDLAAEIEPDGDGRAEVILGGANSAGWLDGLEKTFKQFIRAEST